MLQVAFMLCLKAHLIRSCDLRAELRAVLHESEVEAILASPHRPVFVLQLLTELLATCRITDIHKSLMEANLTQFHDCLGGCERIFRTPIPLFYTRLTSRFLVVWHMVLPLALWEECHWATVPATIFSAAALFCVEEVGVLIEEPFGILPLDYICVTCQKDLEDLTRAHDVIQQRLQAAAVSKVLVSGGAAPPPVEGDSADLEGGKSGKHRLGAMNAARSSPPAAAAPACRGLQRHRNIGGLPLKCSVAQMSGCMQRQLPSTYLATNRRHSCSSTPVHFLGDCCRDTFWAGQ
eukprot:SM000078S22073  [mRNA]  locus=s78:266970:268765:- [translate_table: standard]